MESLLVLRNPVFVIIIVYSNRSVLTARSALFSSHTNPPVTTGFGGSQNEKLGIMEAMAVHSGSTMLTISAMKLRGRSPFTISLAGQKSPVRVSATRKGTTVFPIGEPGPRELNSKSAPPVKLLTNVEKLRLLSKAEKAGLLSAAENLGFSLSTVERLGLLSKAEELGILSAATDPGTPSSLYGLSLFLLGLGPVCVYIVPEQYPWEIGLQVVVALASVVGGSAAFAASSFVSKLQKSS